MRRRDFLGFTGLACGWWSSALAQAQAAPRIAVLWHAANAEEEAPYFQSLIEGFRNLGYDENRVVLEHRFPNEMPELFASMAAELVSMKPDVLIAVGGAAPYAKKATSTVPIVFMYVPDPVGSDLVESIRRPAGNATGLTNFSVELTAKRLELLKDIIPALSRVALLVNPAVKISKFYVDQSDAAGGKLGLRTQAFQVRSLDELDSAFDAMTKAGMQALVVNAESLFYQAKDRIGNLALDHRLPTCVWVRELVESGALLSYGADQRGIAGRVALYVHRILKGEKPAEMPVETPSKYELSINLRTARLLQLTVPQSLLAGADELVE